MTTQEERACAIDIEEKLPLEQAHLDALERMRTLEPYYRWTFSLLEPYLGRRVMDAGCGIGNFTQLIAERAGYVLATDLSPRNIELLSRRFCGSESVEVLQADLGHELDLAAIRKKVIDTVVCLDVLEHIEDDVSLLASFRELVQPGGTLLLKVPACTWLYGSIDVASSHYRRYSKATLIEKAEQAGWESVDIFHMNVFGVLPYWFKSRILKKSVNFSRTFSHWQIQLIRHAIPLMKVVDGLIGPPIGQSVILVAK